MAGEPDQSRPGGRASGAVREGFTAPELSGVLARYELGKIHSVRELRAGDTTSPKAVIECARGRMLLKRRAPTLKDPYRVAFQHDVQLALEGAGFPIAQLIGDREHNNSMVQLDGDVYELFRYVDGVACDGSESQCEQAGAALAAMHRALDGFRSRFAPTPEHAPPVEVIRRRLDRVRQIAPGARAAADELEDLCTGADERLDALRFDRRPTRVIHGDWHPGNTLFRDDRLAGVIDFDASRLAPAPTDLAQGLLQFSLARGGDDPRAWDASPDEDRLVPLFRGYVLGGGEGADEQAIASIPHLMIESLIREAAQGVAGSGRFGPHAAPVFLTAIARKASWLSEHADALGARLAAIGGR